MKTSFCQDSPAAGARPKLNCYVDVDILALIDGKINAIMISDQKSDQKIKRKERGIPRKNNEE